jgi:hypothetical protein
VDFHRPSTCAILRDLGVLPIELLNHILNFAQCPCCACLLNW